MFARGGLSWRSWNVDNTRPTENFDNINGIRAETSMTLKPGNNDVVLKKSTDLNYAASTADLHVYDVDYDFLHTQITFNTRFFISGKAILQVDFVVHCDEHECMGSSAIFNLVPNNTIVQLAPPIVKALDYVIKYDYMRSWRAFIPVMIRLVNPTIVLKVDVNTDAVVPKNYANVKVDITCVVQLMNSVIKYLGYGGERPILVD